MGFRALTRNWRARGRIEHTLLDERRGLHPNRPKTFARKPTIPQKVTNVSIHDKGPGHPEGYPGPVGSGRSKAPVARPGEVHRHRGILESVSERGIVVRSMHGGEDEHVFWDPLTSVIRLMQGTPRGAEVRSY